MTTGASFTCCWSASARFLHSKICLESRVSVRDSFTDRIRGRSGNCCVYLLHFIQCVHTPIFGWRKIFMLNFSLFSIVCSTSCRRTLFPRLQFEPLIPHTQTHTHKQINKKKIFIILYSFPSWKLNYYDLRVIEMERMGTGYYLVHPVWLLKSTPRKQNITLTT